MTRSLPIAAAALVLTLAACGSSGTTASVGTTAPVGTASPAPGTTAPVSPSTAAAPSGTATTGRSSTPTAKASTPSPSATATTRAPRPGATSPARSASPTPGRTTASPKPSPTRTAPSTGGPRLTVSPVRGLDPDRAVVTVRGRGYDTAVGIYVAVCTSAAPTAGSTCVGGADMTGGSGSSAWISSDPPPYGDGLAKPYGPGGTFTVTLTVRATGPGIDCTATRCGVITRADHTRYGTRKQDAFVSLSFR